MKHRVALALLALLVILTLSTAYHGRDDPDPVGTASDAARSDSASAMRAAVRRIATALGLGRWVSTVPDYAGHDARGIPNYTTRIFTPEERRLLRTVYGIEDPNQLYLSDSTEDGILRYDTKEKECRSCLVNSYRVGFVSIRRPGESWEELERRVHGMSARDFPKSARIEDFSTDELDPAIRADVERMLVDAARAGFTFRIRATYRSPEREAFLMKEGDNRTHTLTSIHSYGRAIDIAIGDGNPTHEATRRRWIVFRHWLMRYRGGKFHILGTPEHTWDWPHVEVPDPDLGFHTIDAAIARARACSAPDTTEPCDFEPHLPATVPIVP